jgi:hypothetical protein
MLLTVYTYKTIIYAKNEHSFHTLSVPKLEKVVFIRGIKRQLLASYLVLISLEKPSFPNLQKNPRTKLKPLLAI